MHKKWKEVIFVTCRAVASMRQEEADVSSRSDIQGYKTV